VIIKFIIVLMMMIGLMGTLSPRFPGTLLILAGAFLYGLITDFVTFQNWIVLALGILVLVAEIGGRVLRIYLTQNFRVSRIFSTDTTAGNIGGLVVTDALLGPVIGTILWEFIVGKTLFPRFDTIIKVLTRLFVAAGIRYICGVIMMFLIIEYIFL